MTPTELYTYHRWANRRLFDVADALGDEMCARPVGSQFSMPSLLRMFAHVYAADRVWLTRWKGQPTGALPGGDIPSMSALRTTWDTLCEEQQSYVESLKPVDLGRMVHYKDSAGTRYHTPLGILLTHVAAHGNHHRSEIATMITMLSASPPDTGVVMWHRTVTGQLRH